MDLSINLKFIHKVQESSLPSIFDWSDEDFFAYCIGNKKIPHHPEEKPVEVPILNNL